MCFYVATLVQPQGQELPHYNWVVVEAVNMFEAIVQAKKLSESETVAIAILSVTELKVTSRPTRSFVSVALSEGSFTVYNVSTYATRHWFGQAHLVLTTSAPAGASAEEWTETIKDWIDVLRVHFEADACVPVFFAFEATP